MAEATKTKKPVKAEINEKDERMWAMFCHLSSLAMFVFPFGNIIGPLVIWSLKKDIYPLVEDQGREVLNFQISMTIYIAVSVILIFIAIGIPILIGLGFFSLIVTVIGAIKANSGEKYRYPLAMHLLK